MPELFSFGHTKLPNELNPIIEHTRLVDSDNYRFRVIYSWNKDMLKIVENHHEIKIIK